MKVRNDATGARRLAGGLALLLCLFVTCLVVAQPTDAAPTAPAQAPYPTIPPPPPPTPACPLTSVEAVVGGTVTVTVTNLPVGTEVQLLLGTTVVATGTVPAPVGGTALADGESALAARSEVVFGNITLSFVVPSLPPGSYEIVAVAGTLRLLCGLLAVDVVANVIERERGLAITGASIAALVALALLLLTIGFGLVRRSRARRGAAAEAARRLSSAGWERQPVSR